MAALIIPNGTPFGGMTNQMVGKILALNTTVSRLKDAIATAASGYTGVEGTEYEAPAVGMNTPWLPNNFGVSPNPDTPGENGTEYAYAVNILVGHWDTFFAAAEASLAQLDNGGATM
jgi:hypothetical protein